MTWTRPLDSGWAKDLPARVARLLLGARPRRRLLVVGLLAFVLFFYLWTAWSGGEAIHFHQAQTDYYNLLADGFLHGHLYIPVKPSPALLALKNPYDPITNAALAAPFHDLSLYHGHFYLTWGPSPVITLFIPWRVLGLGAIPQNLAAAIFAFVGLCFAVRLLCFLVDTYLPRTRSWMVGLATVALAMSSVAPFLLRRAAVYEVCISCAYCFLFIGLYLLARGGLGGNWSWWRLCVGGLSLGIATGSRYDLGVTGVVLLVVALRAFRRGATAPLIRRLAGPLVVLAPFVLVLALLAEYNKARFGSFTQYGLSYQLSGIDLAEARFFNPGFIAPSLWYYLVSPVQWSLAFPFFVLPPPPLYPGAVPASYVGVEIVGGILTTTPILIWLATLPFTWKKLDRELRAVLGLTVLVAVLILFAISYAVIGSTMRYEADFATLFLLPALLLWMASAGRVRWRRVLAASGALLVLYGALVGVAVSLTGYYDELELADPGTYHALETLTSPLPTIITTIVGHPVVTRVFWPHAIDGVGDYGTCAAGQLTVGFAHGPIEVDVVSPGSDWRLVFGARSLGPAAAPLLRISDTGRHRAEIGLSESEQSAPLHGGVNRITLSSSSAATIVVAQFSFARQVAHHSPPVTTRHSG